jgi:hypothetical protein
MYIPLAATPLGWVILGVAGYLVCRAGKNAGKRESEKRPEKSSIKE